ncbi:hypothetical protein GCM10010392_39550 [Streptomyces clavifer]|uniref:Secreted protein n=1 Tax=Streptomyces clavifer TaxID=68188 RepID=A0ABS4VIU3_9ACTN|nr:hypothetical protein [Streptomyces clavifer]GHB08441.1 hypothetical protein GCM10010392_39550 [Streptomyces clavifer]
MRALGTSGRSRRNWLFTAAAIATEIWTMHSVALHARRAVRDQHHRLPARVPGPRRGRGAFVGGLFTHPLKVAFGDGEFVPLGPHLRQLCGQLFFEFVQFRGDPFQQLESSMPWNGEGRRTAASTNRTVSSLPVLPAA